jgi:hypothetical protein
MGAHRGWVAGHSWETIMKIKALALGGAALLLATAAYASEPPSSPAERAQTQQLNQQSLQAAQQGQSLNASQTSDNSGAATSNMASNDSAAANPAAAPTPQVAQNNMSAPDTTPLAAMSSPPTAIATASVVDNSGATVGAVNKVEVAASGAPLRVDVALTGETGHVVAIDANALTYDSSTNVLTARASADQIKAMPAIPQG